MRRPSGRSLAAGLRYCDGALARATTPEEIERITRQRDQYITKLAGRCRRCGRELKDPAATIGRECAKVVAA